MTDNLTDPPKAWVWSQYRGFLSDAPPADTRPRPQAFTPSAAAPSSGPERPPLVPKQSGSGAGILAALLILAVIGGVWWMTQTAPPPAPSSAVETPAGDAPPSDQASATPSAPPAVEPNKEAANAPAPVEAKPATPVERLAAAKEKLAALPAAGPLDAAACESALNASVTVEKIQFRSGRPSIANASVPLLNRLAALLKRCPDAKVEISGYTDNVGPDVSNQKLSQRRAEAVRDYLKGQGVRGDRLTAIGRGSANPVASNDTEEGRAENRRIEFTVK